MGSFVADFETNTNMADCRVWAYAICEVGNKDNIIVGTTIDDFMKWYNSNEKKSISEKDVLALNPIIVQKELKRTKYRYDIATAFEQLKQNKLYHHNDIAY
jgi:hypothetical protein